MAATFSTIETIARRQLIETTARFWTSPELTDIIAAGVRDLWRDIVDLKQEHFLIRNNTDVFLDPSTDTLRGVPADVHKVYLIEPVSISENGSNEGLQFRPLPYNHQTFQLARTRPAIDPSNDTIYYEITQPGGPVTAPVIYVAPKVTSQVALSFVYVPTLGDFTTNSIVPIPGESTNALVAWTVAFARAKERDDRSVDPNSLAIFATEKQHLLQSLGLRQYQEPQYADAVYETYWG
jgi:hypothetical protein